MDPPTCEEIHLDDIQIETSNNEESNEDCNNESVTNASSEELETLLSNCAQLIGKLRDSTRFSYAGVFATTLSLLFFSNEEREYRHTLLMSLIAHLNLPENVINSMLVIADGDDQEGREIFLESMKSDPIIKENLSLLATDLVAWIIISSNGKYDARSRILIRHMTWQFPMKSEHLEDIEESLLKTLRESSQKDKDEQESARKRVEKRSKMKRYALIGLATAGGGAIIGLTGGLAAPLVAAGAGAIFGGASAAALGSVAGIAVITSLFGAAGAGLTGYKMKRRVGGIDEFEFRSLTPSNQLSVTVAISGWLSEDPDCNFLIPWRNMLQSKEQYALYWESKHLMRLGKAFEYILDTLVSYAAAEALKYTILAGLITAIAWPAAALSAASVIDNPWSVCLRRSVQVGRQLAEVLLSRQHGQRPVTLIGYSLGARVIYHCLEEMKKRKNHSGIVEDVYLLGAPVTGSPDEWMKLSSVVAGHITNAYCRTDLLLRFLYRTSEATYNVAGLQPIEWQDRRMINIDLTSVISGHLDYAKNMDTILSAVGVRTKDLMTSPRSSKSLPTLILPCEDEGVSASSLPKSKSCDGVLLGSGS